MALDNFIFSLTPGSLRLATPSFACERGGRGVRVTKKGVREKMKLSS
jgi:hypothetical protein